MLPVRYKFRPQRNRRTYYTPDISHAFRISQEGHSIYIIGKMTIKAKQEIVDAFSAIPKTITFMCLKFDSFENWATPNEIAALIPETITELDLGSNYEELHSMSTAKLSTVFAACPRTLTGLNLNNNVLGHTSLDLAAAFVHLPPDLKYLSLTNNYLYRKSGQELKDAFEALPATLEVLILKGNYFGDLDVAEFVFALKGIPLSVKTLDLTLARLKIKTRIELCHIFANIPKGVNRLVLQSNWDKSNSAKLAAALPSIPQHVSSLDLSGNMVLDEDDEFEVAYSFDKKVKVPLVHLTRAIPKTIAHLNFSLNELCHASSQDLMTAFAALDGLTCLDLTNNELSNIRSSNLKKIFSAIPHNLNTLILSYKDIAERSTRNLIALGKCLSYVLNIEIIGDSCDYEFDENKVQALKNSIGTGILEGEKQLLELKNEKNRPLFPTPIIFEILSMVTGQEAELTTFLEEHRPYLGNLSLFNPKPDSEQETVIIHVPAQCCTIS